MPVDITPLLRTRPSSAYTSAWFLGWILALEFALFVVAYLTLWGR